MGALSREEIEEKLAAAAKGGHFLFYEDLLTKDAANDYQSRQALYRLLGEINDQNQEGLNITALVVDERTGMPGPGFFRGLQKNQKPSSPQEIHAVFCGEVWRIFDRYRTPDAPRNFAVLIDADNCGNFAKVEESLKKEIPGGRDAAVCCACGKDKRDMTPLKRHHPHPFIQIKENLRDKSNAADFALSMQGAVMLSKPLTRGIIDVVLVYSGDSDLSHLVNFASPYKVEFRQFNNQGERVPLVKQSKLR